ncbi:hypothetical protein NMG60_11013375 [Bertholletia excelsa]
MGKLGLGKVFESLCIAPGSCTCFCTESLNHHDEFDKKPLVANEELMRLKDVLEGPQTLALQLKPKKVVLRVSMHCYGCAKRVEKHISKMDGVTSYQIDLETQMVVVIGDIIPFEVLENVSKIKKAEIWTDP